MHIHNLIAILLTEFIKPNISFFVIELCHLPLVPIIFNPILPSFFFLHCNISCVNCIWPVTVSGQMGKGKEIALVKQHVQRMNSSSSSSEGDGAQCPAQLRHLRLLSCQTCGGCCCCCCCSRDNLILELALLRQRWWPVCVMAINSEQAGRQSVSQATPASQFTCV